MTDSEKLDLLLEKVGNLDEKVSNLDEKVNDLDKKVSNLDEKVNDLNEKVNGIEKEVARVKMTLENETNRNIMIIAEGHLDLSRKLNECIRISSDIKARQEIQDIFISVHDNKLKAL